MSGVGEEVVVELLLLLLFVCLFVLVFVHVPLPSGRWIALI